MICKSCVRTPGLALLFGGRRQNKGCISLMMSSCDMVSSFLFFSTSLTSHLLSHPSPIWRQKVKFTQPAPPARTRIPALCPLPLLHKQTINMGVCCSCLKRLLSGSEVELSDSRSENLMEDSVPQVHSIDIGKINKIYSSVPIISSERIHDFHNTIMDSILIKICLHLPYKHLLIQVTN